MPKAVAHPVASVDLSPVEPTLAGASAEVVATLRQLIAEHRGRVPAATVREVFSGALAALAGSGAPGAVPELAYRLARQRLSDLPPAVIPSELVPSALVPSEL